MSVATKKQERVNDILVRLKRSYPKAACTLDFTTPFELLIATMLSAQSTDARVNIVTKSLFRKYPDARAFAAAKQPEMERDVRQTGFFRNKAKAVIAASKAIVEKHAGEVPRTMEELTALPGVGRKTANVVLNAAFGEPTIAVDTHVFRVCNRTGLAPGKDPLEVEQKLLKVVPKKYLQDAHHYLILHGRYTCVAKKPLCGKCPVYAQCEFKEKKKFAALTPAAARG